MMTNPILDKITKLNAEIEQLRAENSHLRRVGVDRPSAELQEAALAELRAENERLRARVAKLEQALQWYAEDEYNGHNATGACARAALKETTP